MSDISAQIGAGGNTFVSTPGAGAYGTGAMAAPNGSGAPGANMPMGAAVLVPLAGGAIGLAVLYNLFRREGGLPPLRIDAANAMNVYFSWLVINVPLKLLAYKYHGHKLSQAFLLTA